MNCVAVYGTLKQNESAFHIMNEADATFIKEVPIKGFWTIKTVFSEKTGKYHPFIMPSWRKNYIMFEIFQVKSFERLDK